MTDFSKGPQQKVLIKQVNKTLTKLIVINLYTTVTSTNDYRSYFAQNLIKTSTQAGK